MLLARPSSDQASKTKGARVWPPILATWGEGGESGEHAHHALHLALCREGSLRVRSGGTWRTGAGVLTAADAPHAIDYAMRHPAEVMKAVVRL